MTIVVGYVPTPEGEAALDAAIAEARLRDQPLHARWEAASRQTLVDAVDVEPEAVQQRDPGGQQGDGGGGVAARR